MHITSLVAAAALALLPVGAAQAAAIVIHADRDASFGDNVSNAWNVQYRWVGTNIMGTYASLFGFDLGRLHGKQITSVDFSAFHNYTYGGDGTVAASFGLDNTWQASTITAYSAIGPAVASNVAGEATLGSYQTWKLGKPVTSDGRLSVVLSGDGWNDYEALVGGFGNGAYLTVHFAEVPEPASLGLLGLGMAGLAAFRRRKPA